METLLEQELPELSQFVGEACPSNNDVNNRHPTLELNHDVFLSHSGKQKDFTEQLYWELKQCQYHPFFDKDCDSLPVGKKFPERIFNAARQCRVAVFILSEDFFTNSKWPMLELAAFVESQKESHKESFLVPVYLRISKDEVKDESNHQRWFDVWSTWQPRTSTSSLTMTMNEKRPIDVRKWKEGLETLLQCNGLHYDRAIREYGLIQDIVSAVRRLVPPRNPLSDPNVQGVNQICKAIREKISETQPSPSGAHMVGIYGIGGIGKSTCCKVLCDYMDKEFEGRVCYAELGSLSRTELQKEVLGKLTNVNHKSLKTSSDAKIGELLKELIHQQKVFLALDNVWPESEGEANTYLRAGFCPGSIVMVTTRSIDILGHLQIDRSVCMEMPELEAEDARRLFLHHAAPDFQPKTQDDHNNIQFCIEHCHFSKGEKLGAHFHPLALKVLGGQLQSLGCDPSIWVKNLSKDNNKFNQPRKEHPVFGILRRSYDLLSDEDQLLFMDAVLFHPDWQQNRPTDYGERGAGIYEWFRIVHNSSLRVIKKRLEGLKEKSLLDNIGDGVRGVSVHDLYVEFAKMEANRGALDARRLVWCGRDGAIPTDLWKTPFGNCWQNVERVSVVQNHLLRLYQQVVGEIVDEDWFDRWQGTVQGVWWQHFANVVVLELYIDLPDDDVLDLSGLQCLRSLRLKVDGGGTITGLGGLWNLAWLEVQGFHDAACVNEIGSLTKLEVLRLRKNCFFSEVCPSTRHALKLSELHRCIRLRELVVHCKCLKAFPDLGPMTSMRKVVFWGCRSATQVLGLGSQLCALQELRLIGCKALRGLQGLGDLGTLQILDVDSVSEDLLQFPDLRKLTCLRELEIRDAPNLSVLPEFQNLVALEQLALHELPMVRELPDMHSLTKLRYIKVDGVALWSDPLQLLNLVPSTATWICRGQDRDGGILSSASPEPGLEMSEFYGDWYKVTLFAWGDYM